MDLMVNSYHLGRRASIKSLRQFYNGTPIKSDGTFLLYQIEETSFIYVKDFGCVVFVNMETNAIKKHMNALNLAFGSDLDEENYLICVKTGADFDVDFDTITIPDFDIDMIHIIVLNLAQSAALNHYQHLTDELLEETRELSNHLEETGKVKLTRKRLAKYIGQTMSLRNRIVDSLYIFEAPPLAWKDARLAQLDAMISEELDFDNRHRAIQAGLAVIRENHDFYKDALQHKHSSLLEWIIIILILFEVVQIFID